MKITKDVLKAFVEANPQLVSRKESSTYPGYFILKYSRKVFYDALWNDVLEECRGLVVDKDWNIIAHPFTKIYNHGENGADMAPDDKVTAVRKMNGFMSAVTVIDHKPIVSTTGSLDSPFVQFAKDMLGDLSQLYLRVSSWNNYTFIFEIVHPDDPHIIVEEPGAYLIGMRDLSGIVLDGPMLSEWKLDKWANVLHWKRPKWKECKFSDVVSEVKNVEHEGFVVRRVEDDYTLKIKSPYYLTLKAMARKKDVLSLDKTRVEEEYYPLLEHLKTIESEFNSCEEQVRLDYIRKYLG